MVCRNGQPKKTDPFWLNYMGKAETRGGLRVSEFFERTVWIWITTTMIRTLVEMEADDAQDAGDITPKQKTAVHFIKKSVAGQVESSSDFFEGRGLDVIAENDGGREFHMAGEGDVLLYSYLTTLQTVTAVNHLDVALRGAQITRARISFVSESLFHRKS
jgi:hypothetical protein